MATGLVASDLSVVLRRNSFGIWKAPVLPSRRVLQSFVQTGTSASNVAATSVPAFTPRSFDVDGPLASRSRRTPDQLIAAVRAAQDLKSQDASTRTTQRVLANPLLGLQLTDADIVEATRRLPVGKTLRRSRVRLDIASSLWQREWYGRNGPTFRYVACDASPQCQQSYEVFVSVERIVRRADVAGHSKDTFGGENMFSRLMPLVTLGHGRTALEDKVSAHIHQTSLEYGPSANHVLAAFWDARQVLSDMGTELGMANFGSVVPEVMGSLRQWPGSGHPWEVSLQPGHLFPLAMQVPGTLHIVDWIIRETVQAFPWWAEWQADCKRIVQFCHGQAHRERLEAIVLAEAPEAQRPLWVTALSVATGRFAEWRWKTLAQAVKDMARLENPLRWLAAHVPRWDIEVGGRDVSSLQHLQVLCGRPLTWDRSRALAVILEPLMAFMSWLQGCDCHETEILQGEAIACNMKGCRAPALSARLQVLRQSLATLRSGSHNGQVGEVGAPEMMCVLTRALACVNLKFAWVDDLPYLVWQASPACFLGCMLCRGRSWQPSCWSAVSSKATQVNCAPFFCAFILP